MGSGSSSVSPPPPSYLPGEGEPAPEGVVTAAEIRREEKGEIVVSVRVAEASQLFCGVVLTGTDLSKFHCFPSCF